jgi:NAD(P)-dependent dehydrogenase (short-subunit alcohol dehydrogenase family)
MIQVDGAVVLITGGASGIGAGVARQLARSGARVVIADVAATAGEAVAAEIGGVFVRTDVSELADNQAAVEAAVERFGRLDLVFLNAGVGGEASLVVDFRPDHYRRVRAINFDGVVYGVHAAVGQLRQQGKGAIIVTSSLAGLFESPVDPVYAATKHAVVGLVRSLAPSLAEQGITINALCPTLIDTPMLAGVMPYLIEAGIAVLNVDRVADTVEAILADGGTGQAWPVLPHEGPSPFVFPGPPELMVSDTRRDAEVRQ